MLPVIGYICHPSNDLMHSVMEMKKYMIMGAIALLCGTAAAQTAASDPVLMTVDGVAVPRSEFEAIYKKNNKEAVVTKEALDEYLELFTNY